MGNVVTCENCKQEVQAKLEFSWLIVIITLLLFWPATVIYMAYKMNKRKYVCPMCGLPLNV